MSWVPTVEAVLQPRIDGDVVRGQAVVGDAVGKRVGMPAVGPGVMVGTAVAAAVGTPDG